jgi:hypothetical protein
MIKKNRNILKLVILVMVIVIMAFSVKFFGLSVQDVKDQLELFLTILSLLAAVIGFYAMMTSSVKAQKIAEAMNEINQYAHDAVEKAEDFIDYSGNSKKQFALTYINQECIENGIPFNSALASELIEKAVALSNKVGARHKAEQELIDPTP